MTEPRTNMGREWLELLDQDAPTAANDPEEWAAEWHAWRNDMEHRIITIEREASATTPSLPLMDNDHRRLTNIGDHEHDDFGHHSHIVDTEDPSGVRLGGLIERAIRDHQRKLRSAGRTSGLMPDGWTIADMVLSYPPETPAEPSQSIPVPDPLPPCPICGKDDLFVGTDGKPGCPHCEVAVVLPSFEPSE